MKALLFFIMSMLVSVAGMAQKPKFNIEADLQRLDYVVTNSANYDRQKQQNINLIKRSMGAYVTPMERYNYFKRLYDENTYSYLFNNIHYFQNNWSIIS